MTGGTRPVRAVIIGGGMIADVHRRAILLNGGQILGVLSSSSDSTRRLADQWNVTAFEDYPAALASDADVIHVCTPNASHAAYSIQALERGKNVVCEKPLGLTVEETEAMRAAAYDSAIKPAQSSRPPRARRDRRGSGGSGHGERRGIRSLPALAS